MQQAKSKCGLKIGTAEYSTFSNHRLSLYQTVLFFVSYAKINIFSFYLFNIDQCTVTKFSIPFNKYKRWTVESLQMKLRHLWNVRPFSTIKFWQQYFTIKSVCVVLTYDELYKMVYYEIYLIIKLTFSNSKFGTSCIISRNKIWMIVN